MGFEMILKECTVVLQAVLQVFCIAIAWNAFWDIKNNGSRDFWWWFILGFSFQLIRRIMYLLLMFHVPIPDLKFFTFIIVPTGVSISYAIAMWKVVMYAKERNTIIDDDRKKLRELTEKLVGGDEK